MHNHDHGDPLRPTPLGRPREPKKGRRGVNPTFQAMIEAHDWKDKWVVDIGGALLAYACFGKAGLTQWSWYLYWFCVHPAAQRAGVGVSR